MEIGLLNNRELASIMWLAVAGMWVVWQLHNDDSDSPTLYPLLSGLRSLAPHLLLYGSWVALLSWMAARVGLWNVGLLKHTILWMLLSGLGLFFGATDALKQKGWFHQVLTKTVGATVIVEFVVNLRSFPLLVEIGLQPIVFLAIVLPVVGKKPEHQPGARVGSGVTAWLGFAALAWTLVGLVDQWADLDHGQLAREFVLPLWLTLGALGFIGPLSLYLGYDRLFRMMTWRANGASVWRQKLAVVLRAGPRLRVIRDLQVPYDHSVAKAEGFCGAWKAIGSVRRQRRSKEADERAAAQRLIDNAGLEGWDEDGQRLDQQEFTETRQALRWLATCQMGHYRNQGERYRDDLLPIVESHFERDGLPADHGIKLNVAADGQAWYAYRRTISGWYFAIGAAESPPDQWCYDGAEPPTDFPNDESWSRFGVGEVATHW